MPHPQRPGPAAHQTAPNSEGVNNPAVQALMAAYNVAPKQARLWLRHLGMHNTPDLERLEKAWADPYRMLLSGRGKPRIDTPLWTQHRDARKLATWAQKVGMSEESIASQYAGFSQKEKQNMLERFHRLHRENEQRQRKNEHNRLIQMWRATRYGHLQAMGVEWADDLLGVPTGHEAEPAQIAADIRAALRKHVPNQEWLDVVLQAHTTVPARSVRDAILHHPLPDCLRELAKGARWKGVFLLAMAYPEQFEGPQDIAALPAAAKATARRFRAWNAAQEADAEADKQARDQQKAAAAAQKSAQIAHKAWEKTLVDANAAARKLGMGRELFDAYCAQRAIFPDQVRTFHKWGQSLQAKQYDPVRLLALLPDVAQWRAERTLALKAKRQRKKDRNREDLRKMKGLATPETFMHAPHATTRRVVFHCGPTNSGKTYQCFEVLKQAQSGVYAAPLRLLALEGWRKLGGEAGACRLVTGEEKRGPADLTKISCTIETLDLQRPVEVAVLDEIQMLADPHRGWAWTQALLSVQAQTVVLAGSPIALPWVRAVLARTGETLEVIEHKRPTPLAVLKDTAYAPQAGDAIVTFSRRHALGIRDELLDNGTSVALIYGGLPPEVREAQAARFAAQEAEVLVATDAIGMGLNLPIKRVLFSQFSKFDGIQARPLLPEEIRQIAGRAGRQGLAEQGYVGSYATSLPADLATVLQPPSPARKRVRPWWRPLEGIDPANWYADLKNRATMLQNPQAPFAGAFDDALMARARILQQKRVAWPDAGLWLGAPAEPDDILIWALFDRAISCMHTPNNGRISIPTPPQTITLHDDMHVYDNWTRHMGLLRWIDTHWPGRVLDGQALEQAWKSGTDRLAQALASPDPLTRPCNRCDAPLPHNHRFAICEDCFQEGRRHWRHHGFGYDEDDDFEEEFLR